MPLPSCPQSSLLARELEPDVPSLAEIRTQSLYPTFLLHLRGPLQPSLCCVYHRPSHHLEQRLSPRLRHLLRRRGTPRLLRRPGPSDFPRANGHQLLLCSLHRACRCKSLASASSYSHKVAHRPRTETHRLYIIFGSVPTIHWLHTVYHCEMRAAGPERDLEPGVLAV